MMARLWGFVRGAAAAVSAPHFSLYVLVMIAAVVAGGAGGWLVRGKFEAAEKLSQALAYANEITTQAAAAEQANAKVVDGERHANEAYAAFRKELSHAKDGLVTTCAPGITGQPRLTPEFVRLYDAALLAGDPGRAEIPAVATGNAGVDDLLDVHTENAERWDACRRQLNAIIDWDEQHGR